MIRRKLISSILLLLTGLFCLLNAGYSQTAGSYLTYEELTKAVKALVDSHKDFAKVESIGKSAEGRDIWVLTIAKAGNVPVAERPGLLIAANFEGDHLIGSSLSLEIARYLLNGYATDESVKTSIDNHVFYIMPRLNPDGAETMFAKVKTGRKTNSTTFDGDNDGRLDEDGPDDLNNDGQITVMRVKDVNGLYCIDPDEPMLMKKADPAKGQRGEYSIYFEGIDNDKDGFINEDPAGGTDLNRNFMHAYPYFKENAGKYMVSESETRAMVEWMLAHKNVAMVLTFGESDNLIVPPTSRGQLSSDRPLDLIQFAQASIAEASRVGMVTGGGRGGRGGRFMMGDMPGGRGGSATTQQETSARSQRPAQTAATTVTTSDLEYFNKASEKYKELTGIKTQPALRNPEGAFFQYSYFQLGLPSFSTPGWGLILPADSSRRGGRGGMGQRQGGADAGAAAVAGGNFAGAGGGGRSMGGGSSQAGGQQEAASQVPGIDAQYLKYLTTANVNGFVKWQTTKHPEFGEVEVGGFTPTEISNPPVEKIADLGVSHAKFALYLSTLFAEIKVAKTEAINEGGGLFRIKAEVSNEGFLPTAMRMGVQARSVKPTMVQLEVKPERIISGNSKTNFFQALDGSGKRQKYEWLIK
ncbi:MAG: M14 family metallopeptidase, partial [Bacteroidia bacterium]|nr:M14 family metallopeptidase [Bacteroidia bacterium]